MMKFFYLISIILLNYTLTACTNPSISVNNPVKIDSLSDDSLLTLLEYKTFLYFWDCVDPVSGLARDHYDDTGSYNNYLTAVGADGFGIMAILAGIERGFINRQQGFERIKRIALYLKSADRFHGAWPHFLIGSMGITVSPNNPMDDGGDIVETGCMAQGLLCARQYFSSGSPEENELALSLDSLWKGIDWNWYRHGGMNVLYWHWSPDYAWQMNLPIRGYNECLITYILAESSPTHGIPPEVYHDGWARNGGIMSNITTYGYTLTLMHDGHEKYGGPLFWEHYSFLGLDPNGLSDQYADYWQHNLNHVLINRQYCIENPKGYDGYGTNCWGLTASASMDGYEAHCPENDLGVISPTAALSSFPYTPEYSMDVLKYLYYYHRDKLWGTYGFYDAFSFANNWFPKIYLALDQGPIVVMVENYRSGLLWKLFMSCPEIKAGLIKLGFDSPYLD